MPEPAGRRVTRGGVAAVVVLAGLLLVAPASGADETVPPASLAAAADASTAARRGAAVQQTPVPAIPPWADPAWQTGAVPGCVPGNYIRGVDTGGEKVITFTFDDGPDPRYTKPIVDEFSRRGLTATFFMIGVNLRAYPNVARMVVDRGFAVGNHSITHRYTWGAISGEVVPMNDLIFEVLGVRTPYFRAPGLSDGPPIDQALVAGGMCNLSTDEVLGDHLEPRRPASRLCSSFAANLKPGMIVLLHDGGTHAPTAQAVPCMLDVAAARGYRVVSLAELLNSGTPYEGRRIITRAGAMRAD